MEKPAIYMYKKYPTHYHHVYKIEIKFILAMILDVLIDIYSKSFHALYNEFIFNLI